MAIKVVDCDVGRSLLVLLWLVSYSLVLKTSPDRKSACSIGILIGACCLDRLREPVTVFERL